MVSITQELNNEEVYRLVADSTINWEEWIGPDGNYIYISPSCERITGYSADEFKSDPELRQKIIHSEDRDIYQQISQLTPDESVGDCDQEYRIIHRDGEVRWIHQICQPLTHHNGNWLGQRSSIREISPEKEAGVPLPENDINLLKESLEAIKALINVPTDIAILINPQGDILVANELMANQVGVHAEQLTGQCLWDLFPPSEGSGTFPFRLSVSRQGIRWGSMERRLYWPRPTVP